MLGRMGLLVRSVACVAVLMGPLWGQTRIKDSADVARMSAGFDRSPAGASLRCRTALRLRNDSSFGVRAEYQVEIQAGGHPDQDGRKWITLARVIPRGEPGGAIYLFDQGPASHGALKGWFWLGDGSYRVGLKVFDESGRVCRGELQADAKSARRLALSPGTVTDGSAGSLADQLARDPRRKLKGVTLLLDGAPMLFLPGASAGSLPPRLSDGDERLLIEGVLAVMREIPADSVHLICFSPRPAEHCLSG